MNPIFEQYPELKTKLYKNQKFYDYIIHNSDVQITQNIN
jgi:hypothetical protein